MRTVGQVLSDRLPVLMGKRPTDVEAKALAMTIMETTGMLDWPVIEPPAPGGPCWVVTREALEPVARLIWKNDALAVSFAGDADSYYEGAAAIAAALLGKVRRAKAVGEFKCGGTDHWDTVDDPVAAKSDPQRELIADVPGRYVVTDGDTVAVLEDE